MLSEVPLQMRLTLWVKGGREVNTASTAEFKLKDIDSFQSEITGRLQKVTIMEVLLQIPFLGDSNERCSLSLDRS